MGRQGETDNLGEIDFTRYDASKPIREITYEALKDAIIAGTILPGERIVESSFAKRLNISRTPIREALRKLEQDGLVEYTPRKGVIVKSLDREDIEEIYMIREVLEALALRKAIVNVTAEDIADLRATLRIVEEHVANDEIETASKHSREIHMRMYRLSGLERLVNILNTLDEYMDRFSYMSLSDAEQRRIAAREHGQLIDALEAADIDVLLELNTKHLITARDSCIAAYESRKQEARSARERKDIPKKK